jgi:hypothetical protein
MKIVSSELMRDPLRGLSFDSYPYRKRENEKSIDFSVKMFLYCLLFTGAVALDLPGILGLFGLYCLSLVRR